MALVEHGCFGRAINLYTGFIVYQGISLASYPGLLTPVFVTCSINAGEGLVKLITCNDIPGRVEEWHIPGKTASK